MNKRVQFIGAVLIGVVIATPLWAYRAADSKAAQLDLQVNVSNPVLLADQKQNVFLKIALTGFERENPTERAPVNLTIVLDKSGSMAGEKIQKAKDAAEMIVRRLDSNDIFSLVTYDDTVQVVIPATKVSDKESIFARINNIQSGGWTALFGGVSKGAGEVRKFLDMNRVNRVILLSDGLANRGPSSPSELASLGSSLAREGISVTTIGLGLDYNEDLMTKLAAASDGNNFFAENADKLAYVFDREFGSTLAVVAQEVLVKIRCAPGIRPIRVLGRDAEIDGQTILAEISQIYSNHERYILLEVEVPASPTGRIRDLAQVDVTYTNLLSRLPDKLTRSLSVNFSPSRDIVEKSVNQDVMVAAVTQISILNNERAVELRDAGKVQEAQQVLLDNAGYLSSNALQYQSEKLDKLKGMNQDDAKNLDEVNWQERRKVMRYQQFRDQFNTY